MRSGYGRAAGPSIPARRERADSARLPNQREIQCGIWSCSCRCPWELTGFLAVCIALQGVQTCSCVALSQKPRSWQTAISITEQHINYLNAANERKACQAGPAAARWCASQRSSSCSGGASSSAGTSSPGRRSAASAGEARTLTPCPVTPQRPQAPQAYAVLAQPNAGAGAPRTRRLPCALMLARLRPTPNP